MQGTMTWRKAGGTKDSAVRMRCLPSLPSPFLCPLSWESGRSQVKNGEVGNAVVVMSQADGGQ